MKFTGSRETNTLIAGNPANSLQAKRWRLALP